MSNEYFIAILMSFAILSAALSTKRLLVLMTHPQVDTDTPVWIDAWGIISCTVLIITLLVGLTEWDWAAYLFTSFIAIDLLLTIVCRTIVNRRSTH